VAADGHDQGKLIEAYELKSQLAFVKGSRFVVVPCGMKPIIFADASIRCLLPPFSNRVLRND